MPLLTLPTGTVTFLFTDVEGSTRAWIRSPDAMRTATARHDALIEGLVAEHGGQVVRPRGEGDSRFAVFARASDALAAACAIQLALCAEPWPLPQPLKVRMAIHTGEADLYLGDYYGTAVNHCARLRAIAHGRQVLVSAVTAGLVQEALPAGVGLRDLGQHQLKDLEQPERVWQLTHAGLPDEFPTLGSADAPRHNLPTQLSRFVGRQLAVDEVSQLMRSARLLTLTGPGGMGKTRLALTVAEAALDSYPDGVWLVELAGLVEPGLVARAVASAVGVREEPDRALLGTLTAYLSDKRLLLVLDNCEHLLAACAELSDQLLRRSPQLQILATSREALGTAGETAWHVPSLAVPAYGQPEPIDTLTRYDAIELFVDRATAAIRSFEVTRENAQAIAQVCRRLDGMPLAIELAAARANVLSVDQIFKRLDDRFHLLTAGSRTSLPRQQTLRAAVEWSYDLLTASEQLLFNRLSVFAGGLDLEAAESVCAGNNIEVHEVLDLLTQLVRKSLVLVDLGAGRGSLRFALLETLRQYGAERLAERGEAVDMGERHASYFLALAEKLDLNTFTPDRGERPARAERLEVEHDNLRAALAWWSGRGPVDQALRLAGALGWFWEARGYAAEGRERLDQLLALSAQSDPHARAVALLAAGGLAWSQGDYSAQVRLASESLALSRDLGEPLGLVRSLAFLGQAANVRGDYPAARTLLEECVEICRSGPPLGKRGELVAAGAESLLGNMARDQGDFSTAERSYDAAIAHETSVSQRGHVLSNMGWLAYYRGDLERARALQEESLQIRRQLIEPRSIAVSLTVLGKIAFARGDYSAARALYAESLPMHDAVGNQWGLALVLEGLSALAAENHPKRALELAGAAAALRQAIGRPVPPAERPLHDRYLAPARRALDLVAQGSAWAAGAALSRQQAVANARLEVGSAEPIDAGRPAR